MSGQRHTRSKGPPEPLKNPILNKCKDQKTYPELDRPNLYELFCEYDVLLFDSKLKSAGFTFDYTNLTNVSGVTDTRTRRITISLSHHYTLKKKWNVKAIKQTLLHEMIHV